MPEDIRRKEGGNLEVGYFVGIDVSKAQLDVAVYPQGLKESFANASEGVGRVVQWLHEIKPTLIVVEATGGYERQAVRAFVTEGLQLLLPILGKSEILRKLLASWRRPMLSTLKCWRALLRRCVPKCDHWQIKPPKNCGR